MIGGFLQSTGPNGRVSAQSCAISRSALAPGQVACNLTLIDVATIQAASQQHLFRTPSLDGQPSVSFTGLPVSLCAAVFGRGSAHFPASQGKSLRNWREMPSLPVQGHNKNRGWAECILRKSRWHWLWSDRLRPAVIPWASRLLSGALLAPVQQLLSVATWLRAQPSALPATCFTASNSQAAANAPASGLNARFQKHSNSRTARGGNPARDFLCAHLFKTKDGPCSKRS